MPAPEPLTKFIGVARSIVERAHGLNVTAAAANAEVTLETAKAYVVPTPGLNAAFTEARSRIADFHEEVVNQNSLTPKATAAIENARQLALLAIDELADALAEARPSDEAEAVGLGWF